MFDSKFYKAIGWIYYAVGPRDTREEDMISDIHRETGYRPKQVIFVPPAEVSDAKKLLGEVYEPAIDADASLIFFR